MNRTHALLLAAIALAAASPATAGEKRFGISAGLNLSTLQIAGLSASEVKGRTGGAFAAIFSFRPSDRWSVELRPGFTSGGAKVLVEGASAQIVANYIDVPLLVTRDLGSSRTRPYLLAGVAVSSLTSAKAKLPTGSVDIKRDFEDTDLSFRLGVGIRRSGDGSRPFLEFEYAWGTKDANAKRSGLGAGVGSIENRSAQVRAGVTFGRSR